MPLVRSGHTVRLLSVLEYALMATVILYSSVLSMFTAAGQNTFLRCGLLLLAALVVLALPHRPVRRAQWQRLLLLAAFLLLFLLMTQYRAVRFLLYYFLPLLLLTLYIGLTDETGGGLRLLFRLSDWVVLLAALSLVLFVFGTCLRWLPGAQTVTYYWGEADHTCTTYYFLQFESQRIVFFGRDMVRNCGMFPEAPAYAVFLVTALGAEVLLRERVSWWRVAVLGVTAVTTFSAKAIILAAVIFGLKFLLVPAPSARLRRAKIALLPVVAVAVGAVALVMLLDKMTTPSYAIRLDDVTACLRAFATRPVFGHGYWNDAAVIPFFSYAGRYNNGLSMGVAVILAEGGLYLLGLYVVPMIACCCRLRRGARWRMAAFDLVYFLLLFVTNMPYSFLALFWIAVSAEYARAPRSACAASVGSERRGGSGYVFR